MTTFQIKKSQLVPAEYSLAGAEHAFGSLVQKYIVELQAHHDHHLIVANLKDTPEPVLPVWRGGEKYISLAEAGADEDEPRGSIVSRATAIYQQDLRRYDDEMLARHRPYPAPDAPALVKAAVATAVVGDGAIKYVPDFEIIDDDPVEELASDAPDRSKGE